MKPTLLATAASLLLLLCPPRAAVVTAGAVEAGAPAEDGLLLTRTISPGEGDRFQRSEFSCWIPDAKKPVRGVLVHQHGCTNAAPEQHPPVTGDFHWRAVRRKHDCALLVPMYRVAGDCDEWNDPDSGSERATPGRTRGLRPGCGACGADGRALGVLGALRRVELVRADDRAAPRPRAGGVVPRRLPQAVRFARVPRAVPRDGAVSCRSSSCGASARPCRVPATSSRGSR